MPKFGSHIIFADLAREKRPDLFTDHDERALFFGAVGPDTTLFMFDPATNKPELRKGFNTVLQVLETISEVKDQIERIKEIVSGPPENLANWVTGGLSKDMSYFFNACVESIFLAAKLGVAWGVGSVNFKNPIFARTGQLPADFIKDPRFAAEYWAINATDNFGFPFRLFGHPFTSDGNWKTPVPAGNYSEWWWMDMLHYRKTGDFAKALMSSAVGTAQKSYAVGYLTHVAGDITGHPFINRLVGGPFRNHAYRHLVLETMADTWLWNFQRKEDMLEARLHELIDVSDSDAESIAELITGAMKAVYQPPMVPSLLRNGYPDKEEYLEGYRLLKKYLRLSTSGTIKRPEPPPDSFDEVWNEIKDLMNINVPGAPPVWNGDVIDYLTALFTWFAKGVVLLIMIATLPIEVLLRIVTIAPRWFMYLLNSAIFFMVSAIRTLLCLTGWGYLGREDFDSFGFLKPLITTGGFEHNTYPAETVPNPKPPFYWLAFPKWPYKVEANPTVPMLPTAAGLKPDWMISGVNVMEPNLISKLVAFDSAKNPDDSRKLALELNGTLGFGNAVDFVISMLDGTFPIPNLDLDGDRGIGYQGWEVLPPNEIFIK